jgi:hypothetical protein
VTQMNKIKNGLKIILLAFVLAGNVYAQETSAFTDAKFLLETGSSKSAKTKFLEFLSSQANPDIRSVEAYYNLAKIEEDNENIDKAVAYLTNATSLLEKVNFDNDKKILMKTLLQEKSKKMNQILLIDKNPEEKKKRVYISLLAKSKSALDNNNLKNANNYLDTLSDFITKENMKYNFDYYLVKALILSNEYQYKEADINFKKSKSSLGNMENSVQLSKEIDKMIDQNKSLIEFQEQITSADNLLKSNQYKEAAQAYYLIWINSSKNEFGVLAAKSFALSGQYDKAIKVYETLESKGSPDLYVLANKEKKNLISIMQKKNTLSSKEVSAGDKALEKAMIDLNKAGKYSEVEDKTTEILGSFMPREENLWALEQRAIARKNNKMYQLAINDLTIVIMNNPYKKDNFMLRYEAYLAINDYSRALLDINTAIELEKEKKDKLKKLRLELLPKSIFAQNEEFK